MINIRQSAPVTLVMTWHDGDAVVDPGTVAITVTRADGTVLVDGQATVGSGADERTYALTEDEMSELTVLTVLWDSPAEGPTTTRYAVVGDTYVTLGELRQLDDLGDSTRFPVSKLQGGVDWWVDLVENWCGVSYVPRYSKLERYYRHNEDVLLKPRPRSIQAVTVDGVTFDATGWRLTSSGRVEGGPPPPTGQLVVHYTHGYDEPDEELRNVALTAIRSKLLSDQTGRPSRQTLLSNALGTVRLAQPGPDRATGIPEVDRVLNDRREAPVMVA